MNGSAIRIEWDERNKKQIEEAKVLYIEARGDHREIVDLDGNLIKAFRPHFGGMIIKEIQLKPGEFAVRIFDKEGDRRLIWNIGDPDQVKEAAELFESYISKGWKAYPIDDAGNRGQRIFRFSAKKEEVIFDDKTTKEKLSSFVEKFKEVKMLPRTYPG